MSQFYIGTKQVFAYPQFKDGRDGYVVIYDHGTWKQYQSWSPKEVFEKAYLPHGYGQDESKINPQMVKGFIKSSTVKTEGKTTIVHAVLANGFEIVESSSCVDPANYDEKLGTEICMKRIEDKIWNLLGFALQWARTGIK